MPDYSDPSTRFLAWECDHDCDIEEEVNAAVALCINELAVYPTLAPATVVLRLQSDGQADDFVRPISFEAIRATLDIHEPGDAEKIAALLATRLEEMAAELRAANGTFGRKEKARC
jgi:hypothetical protein